MSIVATEEKTAANCRFIQPSAFIDMAKSRTIADKPMPHQFRHFLRHPEPIEIWRGAIEAEPHFANLSRDQIAFDWPEQSHRNIRLAVNQIGAGRRWQQRHIEQREILMEL